MNSYFVIADFGKIMPLPYMYIPSVADLALQAPGTPCLPMLLNLAETWGS